MKINILEKNGKKLMSVGFEENAEPDRKHFLSALQWIHEKYPDNFYSFDQEARESLIMQYKALIGYANGMIDYLKDLGDENIYTDFGLKHTLAALATIDWFLKDVNTYPAEAEVDE